VGEDEAILDKRPVRPKKRRAKKRTKKAPAKVTPEQKLQSEAAEAVKEILPSSQPQYIEAADPTEAKAVTFFSKYKMDEILVEQSKIVQLGTNKYVTLPPKVARFNDHMFTTADQSVIEYIRNPRNLFEMFDRFGKEVFEVGRPDHAAEIHRLSDAGIEEYLVELHMKGRKVAKAEGFSYESST